MYCAADQRLYFRYTDRTIPLLSKFEISSFWAASVTVQASFENQYCSFSHVKAHIYDCRHICQGTNVNETIYSNWN